jgi:integrase
VAPVIYGTDPTKPMGDMKTAWKEALSRVALIRAPDDGDSEPLKFRMHDLRHTAYTGMRNNNVPLDKIAKILGWSPSQMVRMASIYGHFSLEDLREGVEGISGVPPKMPPIAAKRSRRSS